MSKARYVARPDAILTVTGRWGESAVLTGETVWEESREPVRTGLVDAAGVPLYRVREVHPIGFDLTVRDGRKR